MVLKAALLVSFAALLTIEGTGMGWWHVGPAASRLVFSSLAAVAYLYGAVLCGRIAGDHRDSPLMRNAWRMLTVSAVFSVLRHIGLAAISFNAEDGPDTLAGYITTQSLMVLSLVFLIVGLFLMWRTFSALDLGFSVHVIDIVLFLLIVILVPPIMLSHSFALPSSYNALVPGLRYAAAILLPASTAMGILLHRLALQMRGGAMAKVLRCLTIFTGGRLLMLMVSSVPALKVHPVISTLDQSIMQGIPFLFTLAAAYRWQIAETARSAAVAREREIPALVR